MPSTIPHAGHPDGSAFRHSARRYFNTDAESQVVAVLEALAGDAESTHRCRSRRPLHTDDVAAAPEQQTTWILVLGPNAGELTALAESSRNLA